MPNTVIGTMTDLVIAGRFRAHVGSGIPGCEHIVASRAVSREAGADPRHGRRAARRVPRAHRQPRRARRATRRAASPRSWKGDGQHQENGRLRCRAS
ncbi:MAG: hypothetical protein ACLSHC_14265 [Bilophila wadsworthia]